MLNAISKRMTRTLALLLILTLTVAPAAWALTPEQAYDLLTYYYVDKLPEGIENMTSVEEMVAALNDPYTTYMTAEEYTAFVNSINDDTLVGIGVSIQVTAEGVLIVSVLDGSPALRAGLKAGDLIVEADGTPLAGMGEAATALIRGEEGTSVTIKVRRANGSTAVFTLTRQLIVIPNTKTEVLEDSWGYILCDSFGEETAEHFYDGLEAYDGQVGSWIVDLRRNPGGTSDAAATAAAYFTGAGVLVYFRDGGDSYNYTFAPVGFPQMTEKPLMVLISPYSASGSELFAAAVRDYDVGTLMGQRTFGKGVAQGLFTGQTYPSFFEDGDALKITTYRFYSPNGTTNDKIGVIPHILVSDEAAACLATLMTGEKPAGSQDWMSLTIDGITWYVDLKKAVTADNQKAFEELLGALPPCAVLEQGTGGGWTSCTREDLIAQLKLTVEVRGFQDVSDSLYASEINTLACYQLLQGDGTGNFHPGDSITRGELACLISSLLRVEPAGGNYFSDVKAGDWYANGVNAMYELGFAGGDGDGTFRPAAAVSREELITIVANLGIWLNMELYDYAGNLAGEEDDGMLNGFSSWARRYAALCDHFDLLWKDVEELDGTVPALREEAAALLYNLLVYADVIPY